MSKKERAFSQLALLAVLATGLLLVMLTFKSTPTAAHVMPAPCDFTTGAVLLSRTRRQPMAGSTRISVSLADAKTADTSAT